MLRCKEVAERANDYLEGTLPLRVHLAMQIHLLCCRYCRRYVKQLRLTVAALQRLGEVELSQESVRQQTTLLMKRVQSDQSPC